MDIGEIISDAIRYPSSDWKKILIEGILLILNATVILAFGTGYILRVMKSTLAGYDELPEFDDWGGMIIDGFKIYIVSIVYLIIPTIVTLAIGFGSIAAIGGVTNIAANPFAAIVGLGLAVIIGGILYIIFGLFEAIAIANMALYDELGAAFKFSEIFERISNIGWGKYIVWYIVMIIVAIIAGIIAGILNVIPYIGSIIAILIVYSYFYMFVGRSVALIFASSEEGQMAAAKPKESVEKPAQNEEPEEKPAE